MASDRPSSFRRNSHRLAYPSSAQHFKRWKSARRRMNSTRAFRSWPSRARSSRDRSTADDGLISRLYHAMRIHLPGRLRRAPIVVRVSVGASARVHCKRRAWPSSRAMAVIARAASGEREFSLGNVSSEFARGVAKFEGLPRGLRPADPGDGVAEALRAATTRDAPLLRLRLSQFLQIGVAEKLSFGLGGPTCGIL